MILKYKLYDLDDNLLYIDTFLDIEMYENDTWIKKQVTTSEFADIRKNANWRVYDNDLSFINFSDRGINGDDTLFIDATTAINNKRFAPAWKMFIDSLVSGNIIGIITARSHASKNIKRVVRYVIEHYLNTQQKKLMLNNLNYFRGIFKKERNIDLIEKYLDSCYFIGVTSSEFVNSYGELNVEDGKKIAITNFTKKANYYAKLLNTEFEVHFSDDDSVTIDTIERCMKNELSIDFLNGDFYLMNTNKNNLSIDKKII